MADKEKQGEDESTEDQADSRLTGAAVTNPLSRPTDQVTRPGFRNPANTRSKASKKSKRKKKR